MLAGIDLNLLVALDALLLERSVTRAAQRIGMTQSSLSHVLRRLRALLGDPLFIKTPRGMQPTALARDGRLSLEQYVALPHLLISLMGRGATWVDPVLERLGLRRRIALRVPQYLAAPHIIAETDLILTIATRVARALRGALPLREVPPPVEIPGFTISAYWHAHRQDDAGHRFLREQLFAVAAEVTDEGPE